MTLPLGPTTSPLSGEFGSSGDIELYERPLIVAVLQIYQEGTFPFYDRL